MDHAVSLESARPWRLAAFVASGVAVLELGILVIAGVVLLGRPLATRRANAAPTPAAATPKPKPAQHAVLPRSRTSVLVLNGNGRSGAAHAEASRVSAHGYPISFVGNAATPNAGPTLVMYRPPFQAEAKRLARDLGVRIVGPLDGMQPSALHGAKLAVVLGL